jgi:hypothetical protein
MNSTVSKCLFEFWRPPNKTKIEAYSQMGLVIFLGCVLFAFSPAFAIFWLAILPSPRLVIVSIGG